MTTANPKPPNARRVASHPLYLNEGLSPKKTAFIIVTVIGCIAILWPKVFYPMMFGGSAPKTSVKEQRAPGGCCDVVLDREHFMNSTDAPEIGPQLYRKHLNLYTGEISLRQERPTHLHPESIYQAMRERGRAIPATTTVPIVERKASPSNPPPRIVEGRPGPIPGMRPPMGAGSLHQPQAKGNSMGFVMPLYTIGIIVFFAYTIMKIVFKKPVPNAPYGPAPANTTFKKEVFGQENGRHVEDLSGSKLVVTAIQGLIDAADEQLKIRENNLIDSELLKGSNESTNSKNGNISNGHTTDQKDDVDVALDKSQNIEESHKKKEVNRDLQQRKRRDGSGDRSVASKDEEIPEPQSIYLEGSLAHDSQILVSDSETRTEEVYDAELNGSAEEPAVVLSSKMTLSLINLDSNQVYDSNETSKNDIESPLADDIEIIGHDEK